MAQCSYIREGGEQCKAVAMSGYPLCYHHRPDSAAELKASGRKGGRTGGRGRPSPRSAEAREIRSELRRLASAVESGRLDAREAAVAAQCLNYATATLRVERDLLETEDLVGEVEEMRRRVESTAS